MVQVDSPMPLQPARQQPLTDEKLRQQLGRLGGTPFRLGSLHNALEGEVMLPVSVLNQMRRQAVEQLQALRARPRRWQLNPDAHWQDLLPPLEPAEPGLPQLVVLVREPAQLSAAIACGIRQIYLEFEDPRRYREVIRATKASHPEVELWAAPPRITKPGETWILKQVLAGRSRWLSGAKLRPPALFRQPALHRRFFPGRGQSPHRPLFQKPLPPGAPDGLL